MELHKCLKFGSFVLLLDPITIFQKNFISVFNGSVIISPDIFYKEAIKTLAVTSLSQTCEAAISIITETVKQLNR